MSGPISLSSPTKRQALRRIYLWTLILILLFEGITFALQTLHKAAYRFGWDDDEGAVWWEAAHVTNLRQMYHPIQQYPYFVVPYPPVFHALTWLVARSTGNFLIAGRIICVSSAFGIGLLLGLVVWCSSPRESPLWIRCSGAAVATLLCFRLDALNIYVPEIGVDLPALFLTFLGMFLFLRFYRNPKAVYWAFACFVLAVFTKQTMVAAPLACLIALSVLSRKKAVKCGLLCLGLGLAGLATLSWATGGEILRHLFVYNAVQPFSIKHLIRGMLFNVLGMIPIAAVAALAIVPSAVPIIRNRHGDCISLIRAKALASPYSMAIFVLALQLGFSLLTSMTYGKAGSGVHYFLEWNFVCCALAGLMLVRVLSDWRPGASYNLRRTAVLIFLPLFAITGVPDAIGRIVATYRLDPGQRELQNALDSSSAAVLNLLQKTPGPVYCENMLLVMEAHKQIPMEPGIQTYLDKAGIWNDSGFVALIDSRKFGVIVIRSLDNGFWPDRIVQAIQSNYVPAEHIGNANIADSYYTVYRPRPMNR